MAHKERLLKLAELLEADAANDKGVKFDLALWGKVDALEEGDLPRSIRASCGTTCCAIGLACISGAFKSEGLSYRKTLKGQNGGNNILPKFKSKVAFDAVEAFFEISNDAAMNLFADSRYRDLPTTQAEGELVVAKRIRDFVRRRA